MKLLIPFCSRPKNPPPVGAWRGSDDNGYISAEPSPGIYHMVSHYRYLITPRWVLYFVEVP